MSTLVLGAMDAIALPTEARTRRGLLARVVRAREIAALRRGALELPAR